MGTHNICLYGEIEKIIPELSNTPQQQVLCIVLYLSKVKETNSGKLSGKQGCIICLS